MDWKSNHLGAGADAYAPAGLAANMRENLYDLQLLLYTAALDGYLATRVSGYSYARHFGGARYLYVRGLRADSASHGVHASRPPEPLVRDLARLLGAGA